MPCREPQTQPSSADRRAKPRQPLNRTGEIAGIHNRNNLAGSGSCSASR